MRIAPAIHLIGPERQPLEQWARGRRTPARLVLRAKIVLLAAAGHDHHQIAAAVATSRQTVGLWRHPLPPIGPPAPWRDTCGRIPHSYSGSGPRMGCTLIAYEPSSSVRIRTSKRS